MPSPLEKIIKNEIKCSGPMSVGQFMSLALGHPEHGYYMKRDPFGRDGDFITAPEVSQLFGEMLGAWVADIWMQMGKPEKLALLECGPGRGTLMADIMRSTKRVEGFHDAVCVHLLEISPALKEKQGKALSVYKPQWHETLESVPNDMALIVIANEFLDALPFRQYVGESERMIALDGETLVFVPEEGDVVEDSPEREAFVKEVTMRLRAQGGAALFIDYGHVNTGEGDTFQAVKGHEYVDVFSDIGDADLTSHVDFAALAAGADINVGGPVTQGGFLKALGIETRAAMLKQKASVQQEEQIEKGLHRLIDSDQMGLLFKVIGFWDFHDKNFAPAGF